MIAWVKRAVRAAQGRLALNLPPAMLREFVSVYLALKVAPVVRITLALIHLIVWIVAVVYSASIALEMRGVIALQGPHVMKIDSLAMVIFALTVVTSNKGRGVTAQVL